VSHRDALSLRQQTGSNTMNRSFLLNEVRRSTRNLFWINVSLLAGTLFFAATTWDQRYVYSFIHGPKPLAEETFDDQGSPLSLGEFYSLDTERMKETGIGWDVVQNKVSVRYEWLRTTVKTTTGPRPMFVRINEDHDRFVTGELEEIPHEALDAVSKDLLPAQLLPTQIEYLDWSNFRFSGYSWVVGFGLLAIFAVWNIYRAMRRFADTQAHPVYRFINKAGRGAECAAEIDVEASQLLYQVGQLQLSQNWILRKRFFGLQPIRFTDVVWLYKQRTRHWHSFGVISVPTTQKTFATILRDRHGRTFEWKMKEEVIDQVVKELAERCPWAFVGFSSDIERRWRTDRTGFIEAIDARQPPSH
jgi:hypothetical protein